MYIKNKKITIRKWFQLRTARINRISWHVRLNILTVRWELTGSKARKQIKYQVSQAHQVKVSFRLLPFRRKCRLFRHQQRRTPKRAKALYYTCTVFDEQDNIRKIDTIHYMNRILDPNVLIKCQQSCRQFAFLACHVAAKVILSVADTLHRYLPSVLVL